MRVAFSVLALLFMAASVHAQPSVVRVSAPEALIGGVGWTIPGKPPAPPSPAERNPLVLEYRFPEGPGLPTRGELPDDSQKSPPSPNPSRPGRKKQAPLVTLFLDVQNKGGRVIKAVEWDVSLVDKTGNEETHRLQFRTEAEVAPAKVVTHTHKVPLDVRWKWFTQATQRGAGRMVVRMEAVVYDDGSEWRRN